MENSKKNEQLYIHNVEHTESPHPPKVGPPSYANIPNGQSSYPKNYMAKKWWKFSKNYYGKEQAKLKSWHCYHGNG